MRWGAAAIVGVACATAAPVAVANPCPPVPDGQTALEAAAGSLGVGEFCYYESTLTGDQLSPGGARAIMWTDSGAWLPGAREVHWVGRANGCGNTERPYIHLIYDDITSAWRIEPTSFNPCGHGYDHNTADPDTDTFYFRAFNSDVASAWDGAGFTDLPPISGPTASAAALSYFPGYGLVWVSPTVVSVYDGAMWTQIDLPDPIGSLHHVAEYNPVADTLVLGGGNDARRVLYRLDNGGALTRLADAPLDLGTNGDSGGMLTVDPLSGLYLALDKVSGQWWEFDVDADSWQQTATLPPVDPLATFQVPITTWGLIGLMEYAGNGETLARFWVYKHAPGDPPGPGDTGGETGPGTTSGGATSTSPGTSGAATTAAGSDSAGSGSTAGAGESDGGGCGCRTRGPSGWGASVLGLFALAWRRRR